MRKMVLALASVGVMAVVGVTILTLGFSSRAEATAFHVNYESGQDERDGLTPATAWKHAPGDPNATAAPLRTRLQAGDVVVFAANARYRGTIVVKAKGTADRPITFRSADGGAAIVDGSDLTAARPCRSAAECGGAANWSSLVRIELPEARDGALALFGDAGPLRPAQEPDPSDDFYRNEVDDMIDANGVAMAEGSVKLPADVARALASGGGSLALWVKPNLVLHRPIISIEGDIARFDPAKLHFYTERPSKAAVVNHVSLIDQPGEYVRLPDDRTVVLMPRPGSSRLSLGKGRGAFRLENAAHIAIRNMRFENMSDGGQLPPDGVAIFADKGKASDITIEGNTFQNFVLGRGQGPIILRQVTQLKVVDNVFDTIVLGSGMRLTGTDITITGNRFRRLGRTGIMLIGTSNVTVQGNRMDDLRGVHGNGLSVYLDNRNVRIVGNTITNAKQPATFHGDRGKGVEQNDILFANNLFVATPDALGSLIGWGAKTRGVTIRNNVILGGRAGLRLHAGDTGVAILDNVASGLVVAKGPPDSWVIDGNEWTSLTVQQMRQSASKASLSTAAVATALATGSVPSEICRVVLRHTTPLSGPDPLPGAVGADLRCPQTPASDR